MQILDFEVQLQILMATHMSCHLSNPILLTPSFQPHPSNAILTPQRHREIDAFVREPFWTIYLLVCIGTEGDMRLEGDTVVVKFKWKNTKEPGT